MNLIRINNRFFNMDLLVEATIRPGREGFRGEDHDEPINTPPSVDLKFAAPSGSGLSNEIQIQPYETTLYSGEADAAMYWLEQTANEAVPVPNEAE